MDITPSLYFVKCLVKSMVRLIDNAYAFCYALVMTTLTTSKARGENMAQAIHIDFIAARLASHGLDRPRFASAREVVAHFGCLQAQDIGQAAWNVGSRLDGASESDVRDALVCGHIVRTWPMRGTLHYVDPKKVRWLLSLCASKTLAGFARRRAFLGISDADAEKAIAVMKKDLRGGKVISRGELSARLAKSGIPMKGQWGYHLACYAATRGVICFGPPTEEGETFVLIDDWIKESEKLSRDEQLLELARVYVRSHGPVTANDLAWWSGLGKGDCRKAFKMISGECKSFEDPTTRQTHLYISPPPAKPRIAATSVRLIGGFDEYFLGYGDRLPVADRAQHSRLFTVNGIFFPLILQNGVVAGLWKRAFKKDRIAFSFETLPGRKFSQRALTSEMERGARFYGIKEYTIDGSAK